MGTFGRRSNERDDREARRDVDRVPHDAAASAHDPVDTDREVAWQPASAPDLERFPPREDACRTVRAQLRDRVDGDLTAAAAAAVDDHVHGCRECGLALSRMELEVLRLRRALEPERRAAAAVPAGLTARVMGRIGDLVIDGDGDDADDSAPADFTRLVMARVRREWRRTPLWRRFADRVGAPGLVAVSAAAAALVVLAVAWFVRPPEAFTDALWAVEARSASVTRLDDLGQRSPRARVLHAGDPVTVGSAVYTEPDGMAVLVASSGGAVDRPAVALSAAERYTLHGHGELLFGAPGDVVLRDGVMDVTLPRDGTIGVGRAAWIDAGGGAGAPESSGASIGAYGMRIALRTDGGDAASASIQVTPLYRPDLAHVGDDYKVRVTVHSGRVEIPRGLREVRTIAAGQVVRFDNLGTWDVEPSVAALLDRARDPATGVAAAGAGGPARRPGVHEGRVVRGDTGQPVERARVEVLTAGDSGVQIVETDAAGRFRFVGDPGAVGGRSGPPVVFRVAPGRGTSGLGEIGPVFAELGVVDAAGLVATIALPRERVLGGTVFAADGRPGADARIVPVRFDELFGRVDVRHEHAVRADDSGRFRITGLGPDSEPHMSLALLAIAPDGATALLRPRGAGGGDLGLEIRFESPRPVRIDGLAAGGRLQVLEAVPGAPFSSLLVRHELTVDADGAARMTAIGAGALRAWDAASGVVRSIEPVADTDAHRVVADGGAAFRMDGLESVLRESRPRGTPVVFARPGRRIEAIAARDDERVGTVFVQARDSGLPVAATVFVRRADGRVAAVGRPDERFTLEFTPPRGGGYELFAIGDDGAFGVVTVAADAPAVVSLDVTAVGALEVPGVPAPGQRVVLEQLDGPLASRILWRRLAAGEQVVSGLIAGRYRVGIDGREPFEITVPPGRRVLPATRLESSRPVEREGR